jgi:hypothetical protein
MAEGASVWGVWGRAYSEGGGVVGACEEWGGQ